jgi:hypothetical protein
VFEKPWFSARTKSPANAGLFTEHQMQADLGLLAMADAAAHLSLLTSNLSATLTRFLDAHYPCAPVIGVSF